MSNMCLKQSPKCSRPRLLSSLFAWFFLCCVLQGVDEGVVDGEGDEGEVEEEEEEVFSAGEDLDRVAVVTGQDRLPHPDPSVL